MFGGRRGEDICWGRRGDVCWGKRLCCLTGKYDDLFGWEEVVNISAGKEKMIFNIVGGG